MKIYAVTQNSDLTEGRGPMRDVAYFLHENAAWEFADTLDGVMGYKPKSGTWRFEKYGQVTVKEINVNEEEHYDAFYHKKRQLWLS